VKGTALNAACSAKRERARIEKIKIRALLCVDEL
jgi:hypothetical protein